MAWISSPACPSGSSPAGPLLVPGAAMGSCPASAPSGAQSNQRGLVGLADAVPLSMPLCQLLGLTSFCAHPGLGCMREERSPRTEASTVDRLEIPHFLPWPVEETAPGRGPPPARDFLLGVTQQQGSCRDPSRTADHSLLREAWQPKVPEPTWGLSRPGDGRAEGRARGQGWSGRSTLLVTFGSLTRSKPSLAPPPPSLPPLTQHPI